MRKLSSYARQNQTKKALWELDNIRRSIYILDFIDDPTLRQSVQKALNRGEAYHRMRRAISYVNSRKFRVKTEAEQQIWNECSRLIGNFDFTTSSMPVDIEALAARYQNEDFWRRSMTEGDDDRPQE